MNTTAAALQAGVTVATIRHWCRYGAVAAIKTAGRWVIDAASLAHRITIGTWRTTVTTPDYTALANEARELVTQYTPAKGCHPADRIGGARDRIGAGKVRGFAAGAAIHFERAAQHAVEGNDYYARENAAQATEALAAARSRAAKLAH
jgi:hypothetical protein